MDGVYLGALWRLLGWLPGVFLRTMFNSRWLANHTKIEVRPRNDPITIYGDQLPRMDIWLLVQNAGHFTIELDRLTAGLRFGAATLVAVVHDRTTILPGETLELHVPGLLTGEQASHIAQQVETRSHASLQVKAEFNCKINNFQVDTGHLTGLPLRLVNFPRSIPASAPSLPVDINHW